MCKDGIVHMLVHGSCTQFKVVADLQLIIVKSQTFGSIVIKLQVFGLFKFSLKS